uniref:Uncharacterized protein n=1 Tax=Opuntia streptacantha TaxID=393608 RepID=A0A7C9D2H9_OPUST
MSLFINCSGFAGMTKMKARDSNLKEKLGIDSSGPTRSLAGHARGSGATRTHDLHDPILLLHLVHIIWIRMSHHRIRPEKCRQGGAFLKDQRSTGNGRSLLRGLDLQLFGGWALPEERFFFIFEGAYLNF